jgi:hypothetical protein
MEILNFTGLKKANRLKADILEIAYFFNEERKQDFYNINLLDELYSNELIEKEEYKQLTELFERIYNKIEREEIKFLKRKINNKF